VLEGAGDDVGEDLELAVGVRAEPRTRSDAIFIDDTETSKLVVVVIGVAAKWVSIDVEMSIIQGNRVLPCKREGVEGFEPAVVSMPASMTKTGYNLQSLSH
jgi:hypothetical protein